MGTYILCQTRRAEKPYYIENISRNIYSLEELCYYLYHNIYLIDQTLMNEELCQWLEKELALTTLAARLRPLLGKFADETEFIYPIFKEINYLTYQEMKELNGRLTTLNQESPKRRTLGKGRAMIRNGMYAKAIQVYQNLLKEIGTAEPEDKEEREALTAETWQLLGSAYASLFLFSKAATCYQNAWEISGDEAYLKAYLLSCREISTPIEFESLFSQKKISMQVRQELTQALEDFDRLPETEVYPRDVDELINRLAADYHRSTQG